MIGLTKARFPRPPRFLLCVLPEKKNSDLYGSWKKKNLHELGVVTQCIAPIKISDQYLTNVLLKINSKFGGINSLLAVEHTHSIRTISTIPTLILGMDVSHSHPGRSDIPSIAVHVFQSPNECEERHKILMESKVDGADSAEDSGSSQQYESTLPGIPKGCARELFQNLEAPVGFDDTLKAHFEKIISIEEHKLHSLRSLNDTQAHNSHAVALTLSQVCPNNKTVLRREDFSDAITSNSDDITHGNQGSQTHSSHITSHQISSSPVIHGEVWWEYMSPDFWSSHPWKSGFSNAQLAHYKSPDF